MPKILIIRFSSIGDIIQCMGVVSGIKNRFPDAQIHWITRKDMAQIVSIDNRIDKVWAFDKKSGYKGLVEMVKLLKLEKYDYIYDAHSNIRSNIVKRRLRSTLSATPKLVTRSKERFKRILLFKFGINRFPKPFRGVVSFREPLKKWRVTNFESNYNDWKFPVEMEEKFINIINPHTITLVPSANWEMKRWPIEYWRKLIEELPSFNFIILAGPSDTFCEQIKDVAPDRVENLAGKTTLLESLYLTQKSNIVVSGDTGFLHAADLFNTRSIALIGPTAFGYPSGEKSEVMEIELKCRPCTKDGNGKCVQTTYQRCMVEITPKMVAERVKFHIFALK